MIKDSNFPAEDGENFGKRFLRGAYLRTSGSQIEQNARRAVRSKLNLLEPNARGRSTSFRFRVNSHTFRVNNLKLSTVLNFKRDLGFGGKGL